MTFCSISLHYWILLKCLNFLKLVISEICRKRSFSWIDSVDSTIVFSFLFHFVDFLKLIFKTTSLIRATHQSINFIIMLLNSWWKISRFIRVWILQYLCLQIQFFTEWIFICFLSYCENEFYLISLTCVYSEIRYFHFFVKFSRWFDEILQILHCLFFLMSIIRTCSS